MASVSTYLTQILKAVYGEEVRGSIHDAIDAINKESEAAKSASTNAEKLVASAQAAAESAEKSVASVQGSVEAAQKSADAASTAAENAKAQAAEATKAVDALKKDFVTYEIKSVLLDSKGGSILDNSSQEIYGTENCSIEGLARKVFLLQQDETETEKELATTNLRVTELAESFKNLETDLSLYEIKSVLADSSNRALLDSGSQRMLGSANCTIEGLAQRVFLLERQVASLASR